MGLSDEELAAEFIRRAAFVDANALLKDECGVEYKKPSQVEYYALFKDHDDSKAINEALKHVADMLGCMTYIEYQGSTSRLMVVGEEMAVDAVRHVWRIALKTYPTTLNERVSKANVKSSGSGQMTIFLVSLRGLLPGTRMPTRGFLDCLMV